MKFDLNSLAFVCLHTSGGEIYPPQDATETIYQEDIYQQWEEYLKNDYKSHKKLGIYVHTPFCEGACVFCSCGSQKLTGGNTLSLYLERTIEEMKSFAPLFHGIKFNHIQFGGGTPSIYNNEQLELLLKTIRDIYSFEERFQLNFEISPHTITEEKIKILKKYGASRITIGVQTMTKKSLEFNRRVQTWEKIEKIFQWIRLYDIKDINIDLLPGIPGENLKDFLLNLNRLINLGPNMIHLYPFRPAPQTLFSKEGYVYSEKDIRNRDLMYELGSKFVEKKGYYGVENDSWGNRNSAKNEQEADKIADNCSILGFGYPVRSYIYKHMMYFTWYDMYEKQKKAKYMGIKLEGNDSVTGYILSHFRSGFNIDKLNERFSIDFMYEFRDEIQFLKDCNVLTVENNLFKISVTSVYEKLLYSKVFYSKKYIDIVLEKFGYDAKNDYIEKFKNITSAVYR